MNAGPPVAHVARDWAHTPPSESRCFSPVVRDGRLVDDEAMHEIGEMRVRAARSVASVFASVRIRG